MSESDWHVVVDGKSLGPFTREDLAARIGGDVPADALVWNPRMSGWTPARDVPELAARGPVRPPAQARRPMAAAPAEAPTLNPFRLIARCLRWRGRFDRGEFAMLWFGGAAINALVVGVIILGALLVGRLVGGPNGLMVTAVLVWGTLVLDLILALIVNIGALIRRLNDLGRPSWWVVAAFLPILNLVLILYLLFAPGDPDAEIPASFKGAVIAIVALFGLSLLVGVVLVLAIAVPALSRARVSANEAATIGDIRTVISAQAAYGYSNGGSGFYDSRWECLYRPAGCIPGYQGPSFLDASLGEAPKSGYLRRLHAGGPPRTAPSSPASPSSVESYAIVAWPVTPGKTGVRLFCGDSSGMVCSATDVAPEALVEGAGADARCSSLCQPLS